MKSYRDLEIYVVSKKLAIAAHAASLTLPKFETYEEGSQLRRSSKAITSLIVEGYGRKRYKADFIKYLVYSHAECDETIIHLEFILETGSTKHIEDFKNLVEEYISLSKKVNKFIQWADEHWNEDQ